MRIDRRLLYWGMFLVAIGSVVVVADLGSLDAGPIADALGLWPFAIIAIGIGIVLRRSRYNLAGGMLAAAAPGLLLGGGFALLPRVPVECVPHEASSGGAATQESAFDGPARIAVTAGCGSLMVNTAPGGRWSFDGGNASSRAPMVTASAQSLSIDAAGTEGWHHHGVRRDNWRLTLPTSVIEDLSVVVNAGEGRIGLPGARIGTLDVTTNAAKTTVDLSETSMTNLSGTVHLGLLSVRLPADADVTGSMEVDAGALELCAPPELGLRVRQSGGLSGTSVNGVRQPDGGWQSANYASAAHRADLTVDVTLGNVEINPIGECK
jgi:hypothetical protein